jgi:hypothetical protein
MFAAEFGFWPFFWADRSIGQAVAGVRSASWIAPVAMEDYCLRIVSESFTVLAVLPGVCRPSCCKYE